MKHIALVALGMAACGEELSLENRPCPCAPGWTCETAGNVCVRDREGDPPADGPSAQDAPGQGPGQNDGWTFTEIGLGDGTVEAIQFTDDLHGWLAASDGGARGLHVTSDGGASWQPRVLDVIPYGIGVSPSRSTVVIAGEGGRPVWSSSNRGAFFMPVTWTLFGWPASVRFLDEQHVFIGDEVGEQVFRSEDGGQTWSAYVFNREALPGTHVIESFGDRHAWVVGGPAYNGDGTGATVAYSSDAAKTWTIANLMDRSELRIGGSLRCIAVVSAMEVWVAGENRQVFHTTDGMQNWTQVTDIPSDVVHFGGIAVRGNTVVLAGSIGSGDYALFRSIDGGATFKLIDRRSRNGAWDTNGIHGVTQRSNGDLFVYGFGGLLWKYSGVMLPP